MIHGLQENATVIEGLCNVFQKNTTVSARRPRIARSGPCVAKLSPSLLDELLHEALGGTGASTTSTRCYVSTAGARHGGARTARSEQCAAKPSPSLLDELLHIGP